MACDYERVGNPLVLARDAEDTQSLNTSRGVSPNFSSEGACLAPSFVSLSLLRLETIRSLVIAFFLNLC